MRPQATLHFMPRIYAFESWGYLMLRITRDTEDFELLW